MFFALVSSRVRLKKNKTASSCSLISLILSFCGNIKMSLLRVFVCRCLSGSFPSFKKRGPKKKRCHVGNKKNGHSYLEFTVIGRSNFTSLFFFVLAIFLIRDQN